ncbi:hypothetical protein HUS90_31940 [Pseudomonas protegens]|nr:hypothetical protein [Pseudomonas protegens]
MKMPKRLIAGAAVLMLSASPLLQVMADERGGYDRGGPQQGHWDNRGNEHRGTGNQTFGHFHQVFLATHTAKRGSPPWSRTPGSCCLVCVSRR